MTTLYYEVTIEGVMDSGETIANSFCYMEIGATGAFPSYDQCVTVGNEVWALWQIVLEATMITDWAAKRWVVQGWGESGFPMSFPAVELDLTGSIGTKSDVRDSNALVAIVKKVIGETGEIVLGAGVPSRGYWAAGPMNSSIIDSYGFLNLAGDQGAGLLLWANAANDSIVISGGGTLQPVVFKRPEPVEGTPTPNTVLGYGLIVGGSVRPRASFRRSRNNSR